MNVTQNFQYSDFVDFKRKQNDSLFYPCDNYDIIKYNNQIVIQSKLLPYCSFSHSRPRLVVVFLNTAMILIVIMITKMFQKIEGYGWGMKKRGKNIKKSLDTKSRL